MGPYYPQYSQPTTNPMPFHAPAAPAAPLTPQMMPSNEKSPHNYPDITTWCQYLDSNDKRNQDGIVFAPFGALLKDQGFFRITQLTSEYVTVSNLEGWLGIKAGYAVLIKEYAKTDVQAINEGRLFFPCRQDKST
jgi:hypothetical protein